MGITERQKEILLAIVEEYMEEAKEVGSTHLVNNYDFDVSSATIRNDMVKLMEMGYLGKSHASSGRLPTDMALRFYIDEKVSNEMRDPRSLVQIKQGIFRVRFYPEKLIKEALQLLVEHTNSASFVLLDDMTRHYGVSSLMDYEELKDIKLMQRVLDVLEDENLLKQVFSKFDGDEVTILVGSELGIKDLEECTVCFTKFDFWKERSGHLGVIGSRRMDYKRVVPTVVAIRNSIKESLKGWD